MESRPSHPHRAPSDLAYRFALGLTRLLRVSADTFFARRHGHRAIVLETVAAVPGMVGAMVTHLHCLRHMVDDDGRVRTLMDKAENEHMVSRRTAHRLVGYLEEEAVLSDTQHLDDIDAGRSPNVVAPAIARRYWKLADDATLRDVVLVVRADEAHHRDVNHGLADQLSGQPADAAPIAPYPEHAEPPR